MLFARAKSIARTETVAASKAGRQAAWKEAAQAGILNPAGTWRKWIPSAAACESCLELAGQLVHLDSMYTTPDGDQVDGPPLHPNCTCSEGLVFKS